MVSIPCRRDPLEDLDGALERGTIHGGTLGAIQRKLGMFHRFAFLQAQIAEDSVRRILNHLDRGVNIVLEFGRYGNSLEAYLLVANYTSLVASTLNKSSARRRR